MPTLTEHVVALDPGERTGIASAWMSRDKFVLGTLCVMPRRECALWLAEAQATGNKQDARPPLVPTFQRIVWESWTPRPDKHAKNMEWIKGDKLLSARHIGHFELIAWESGTPTWEYGPVCKEGFQKTMPPALVELQREQSEQHSKDALMHLWGWFMNNWWTGKKRPDQCVKT